VDAKLEENEPAGQYREAGGQARLSRAPLPADDDQLPHDRPRATL
jgi:hypothetical protein